VDPVVFLFCVLHDKNALQIYSRSQITDIIFIFDEMSAVTFFVFYYFIFPFIVIYIKIAQYLVVLKKKLIN